MVTLYSSLSYAHLLFTRPLGTRESHHPLHRVRLFSTRLGQAELDATNHCDLDISLVFDPMGDSIEFVFPRLHLQHLQVLDFQCVHTFLEISPDALVSKLQVTPIDPPVIKPYIDLLPT